MCLQQFTQSILPVLCGTADGVKKTEVLVNLVLPIFTRHGSTQPALNFLCLPPQHRCLVRNPDGRQIRVRVEPI